MNFLFKTQYYFPDFKFWRQKRHFFVNNDEFALDQIEGILISETKKLGDNTVILRLPYDAQVQELVDLLKIGMLNDLKMIIATKEG